MVNELETLRAEKAALEQRLGDAERARDLAASSVERVISRRDKLVKLGTAPENALQLALVSEQGQADRDAAEEVSAQP